jgi:hypothetical protein
MSIGMVAGPPETAQQTQARPVTCGGRRYVVRRFDDGIFAVYDDAGRLLAGWPLTAFWPSQSLSAKADDDWCALIRAIYGQH